MKTPFPSAALLFLAGLAVATMPVAAQFYKPAPGLSVWVDAEYKGKSHTFLEDMPDIGPTGLGRMISSLRVGPKETWQLCTEPNYGGRCRVFTSSVTNLQSVGLNDAIMSIRRTPATAAPPPPATGAAVPAPGATLPPATGLELYANLNYSGRRLLVRNATPDFREIQFSDRALSLRVPPNTTWEICVNIDYDECRLVSENIPDLTAVGFNRIMSSARPYVAGRGRGRGSSSSSRLQIVLYDGVNFTGRSTTLTDDQPSLSFFSSYSGSIRVLGGEWQLCDRASFFGNCVAIADHVNDLSRVNLRGPVMSIRRQRE